MTPDLMIALIGFAFVMSISPGPGNFLLLASGVNYGFLRTLPMVLGISFGFLSMVLAIGLGVGQFLQTYSQIYLGLKLICAAYVLWLAWKISRMSSFSPSDGVEGTRPISFIQAALFQLVNPKAWAVALILTVSYTVPANYVMSLLSMILVFAIVNLPTISVWAIFGVGLRRIMSDPVRLRIFNIAMAILLVGSMFPVLFDLT